MASKKGYAYYTKEEIEELIEIAASAVIYKVTERINGVTIPTAWTEKYISDYELTLDAKVDAEYLVEWNVSYLVQDGANTWAELDVGVAAQGASEIKAIKEFATATNATGTKTYTGRYARGVIKATGTSITLKPYLISSNANTTYNIYEGLLTVRRIA